MEQRLRQKIEDFFNRFKTQSFAKHEIIFAPGQEVSWIYLLKKGLVRMYIRTGKGNMLVAHIFRPGSFFLMSWAVNHSRNIYYFEAITPVEVAKAPVGEVGKFIKDEPEILFDFTGRILKSLDGMVVRLEGLTFDSAYQKVGSLLVYFARRFGKKSGRDVLIDFPLTHREVANWIGTARETASLEIEKFKKKKIIEINKRTIVIKDLKKLEKEAQLQTKIF